MKIPLNPAMKIPLPPATKVSLPPATKVPFKPAIKAPLNPALKVPLKPSMIASNWKKVEKQTLQGFCTIQTASRLVIREVSVHRRERKRWVAMPAKPIARSNGAPGWRPIFEFADPAARKAFQQQALAAIDLMLSKLGEEAL